MNMRLLVRGSLLFAGIAVAAAACTPMQPVTITGDPAYVTKLKSVAVVQFTVSPPQMPMFPLIDAGLYRGSTNQVAPQIIELHKSKVGDMAEAFGPILKRYAGGPVLYGKALVASDGYRKESPDIARFAPTLSNAAYPEAIVPANSFSYMNYMALENSQDALTCENMAMFTDLARTTSHLARVLQVDGVMMVGSSVSTLSVMPFGIQGMRVLEVRAVIFDAAGTCVASGRAVSDFATSRGNDLEAYGQAMAKFGPTADLLVQHLYGAAPKPAATAGGTRP